MRGDELKAVRRNNLQLLNKQRGVKFEALGALISTNPQYLSQLARGVIQKGGKKPRGITDDMATAIEDALHLGRGWMDRPHNSMFEDEHFLCDEDAEPDLEAKPASNVSTGPDTRGLVPLISWVQAGHWHEISDVIDVEEADLLPCPASHGLRSYALRVDGDSMTAAHGRSYPHNSIIYVDPDQAGGVVSGDRVIARLNGDTQVVFKVFVEEAGRRFLRPLNPQYPLITEPFRIIGKVIGMFIPD